MFLTKPPVRSRALCLASLLLPSFLLAIPAPAALAQAHPASRQTQWVGTWAASPVGVPNGSGAIAGKELLYETVHVSRGGSQVRVILTNEFGTESLAVDALHVELRGGDGQPVRGSEHSVSFVGQPGTVIPAGAVAVSDPVAMQLPPLSDLVISLSLPAQPQHVVTTHSLGLQTNYEAHGDALTPAPPPEARPFMQWRYLKSVEVEGPEPTAAAVVTLGDSITDGHKSTPDANRRWPDVLARRLQADPRGRELGVLNEGISGNRLLHDGAGPNALARLDRDILSQDGVRYLIVIEGINDIGHTAQPRTPDDPVTAQAIIAGLTQIIERAHAHGIAVYGATLTPFLGAGYASPAGEIMRETVNTWIRSGGRFDGVIDFDRMLRDPANPGHFLPAFDSGDHLHPSDAGYKAMGEGIDLKLFEHR